MSENVYQIDFNKPESVHFIGIGGISMSGLAEILMDEGFTVSGSDAHRSELTDNLEARGAKVYIGQKAENIQDGIDVVVYTAAIHPDNPEFQEVKRRGDIENYQEIIEAAKGKVITFGHSRGNDYSAGDIQYDDYAHPSFDLYIGGEKKERLTLGVAGEHNVYNALAAIAVSLENGISMDAIRVGLAHFTGTNRRFEKKGEVNGFTIIDDYAHHPHEIEATLKTAQNYPHKTLWCIFQPHTYTRTKAFLPQFAEALSLADKVILADIYAARETDTLGISSEDIVKLLKEKGKEAWYLPTFDEIEKFVMEHCTQGDLLITMGAGDVVNVGENLLAK